jgi:hypothetical protein
MTAHTNGSGSSANEVLLLGNLVDGSLDVVAIISHNPQHPQHTAVPLLQLGNHIVQEELLVVARLPTVLLFQLEENWLAELRQHLHSAPKRQQAPPDKLAVGEGGEGGKLEGIVWSLEVPGPYLQYLHRTVRRLPSACSDSTSKCRQGFPRTFGMVGLWGKEGGKFADQGGGS